MSGSTLFYIAFAAVLVAILVIVGAALVLEAGPPPPAPGQDTDEPSQTASVR